MVGKVFRIVILVGLILNSIGIVYSFIKSNPLLAITNGAGLVALLMLILIVTSGVDEENDW